MRIFLTGGGGFAGRFLAAELASRGHHVIAHVRGGAAPDAPSPATGAIDVVKGDLCELDALPDGLEAVIHTAATSPSKGVTAGMLLRDNAEATQRLVELAGAAGVGRFVFFSSVSVYGEIDRPLVDEETPVRGPDDYGKTKTIGEELLRDGAAGMPALALRLPALIGPGAGRNWPARTLEAILSGDTVTIYNPETPFNNAVHIADLTDLIEGVLESDYSGFDVVTLGAEGTLSVREAVERLASVTNRDLQLKEGPSERVSFIMSSERAKRLYGYAPMEIGPMIERFAREQVALKGA